MTPRARVPVDVTVLGRSGRPVSNLAAEDLTILKGSASVVMKSAARYVDSLGPSEPSG